MVENNNIRREEDETTVKASRRCQKIPVTRRDDFLWTATSKKAVKVKKEEIMKPKHHVQTKEINCLEGISNEKVIKDSSQVPQNKSLKTFHQNITASGNKANELNCHLHHDLPHIFWLSQHHLSESELQMTHLTNYSLVPGNVGKLFLKEV